MVEQSESAKRRRAADRAGYVTSGMSADRQLLLAGRLRCLVNGWVPAKYNRPRDNGGTDCILTPTLPCKPADIRTWLQWGKCHDGMTTHEFYAWPRHRVPSVVDIECMAQSMGLLRGDGLVGLRDA